MKRLMKRLFRKGETGQSIIILALGFVGLLAVVGITTDVSILFARYAQLRRAVDAASIAAAGQMREDRSIATVNATARQFIEFHGLNPENVWVDTCENLRLDEDEDGDADVFNLDEDVCPPDDTRKLIRVTAQVTSPTVFLRLVGWRDVTLEASAISETAVLDVVIVMDVSESMLAETDYVDWAQAGQGYATLPPILDEGVSWFPVTNPADSVWRRFSSLVNPDAANDPPGTGFLPTLGPYDPSPGFPVQNYDIDFTPGAPTNIGPLTNVDSLNLLTWWEEWFWQTHLLGVPQQQVNDRIYYAAPSDISDAHNNPLERGDAATGPLSTTDPNSPQNAFYTAKTFLPNDVSQAITDGDVPATQILPREACRVRFFPYSYTLDVPTYLKGMYQQEGFYPSGWPTGITVGTTTQQKWRGFVPTYNFYGCCNDPGNGTVDDFGNITPGSPNQTAPDGNFSDLVCEPFKQARDATRLFLDRIDFERGDRVAFVTFDRGAHLIDPDGTNGPQNSMLTRFVDESVTPNVAYSARLIARTILDSSIGVRAEPNFYRWNEGTATTRGGIFATSFVDSDDAIGGWTEQVAAGDPFTPAYSRGLDENGLPIPGDWYDADPDGNGLDRWNESLTDYNQYPVAGNCLMQNAAIKYPVSRYSNRNTTTFNGEPALVNFMNPDIYNVTNNPANTFWPPKRTAFPNNAPLNYGNNAYELWASCRGTNMGAALREANNALTNPDTSRREGAVWIIIFLSDGAAGASDPVRINGRLPNSPNPYTNFSTNQPYDWDLNNNGSLEAGENIRPTNTTYNQYGARGEYGFYGVCPPGGYETYKGQDEFGELVRTGQPTGEPVFPFCSDEDYRTRHFCLPTKPAITGGDSSVGQRGSLEAGFGPGSIDTEIAPPLPAIIPRQNIYDLDIGQYGNEQKCSILYDVDDYARDWADFVAGIPPVNDPNAEEAGDDSVLPTIFTIGFGLKFDIDVDGNGQLDWDTNMDGELKCDGSDSPAMTENCLGEELLRYIADVGDNFRVDTDYQQDLRSDGSLGSPAQNPDGTNAIHGGTYGPKDPCQDPDVDYVPGNIGTISSLTPGESCGNYFNAPSRAELQQVFDEIASRMFTRLAG